MKKLFSMVLCVAFIFSLLTVVNAEGTSLNIADGSIMLMESNGNKTVNMKAYTGNVTVTGSHEKNYIYAYTGEHDVTIENINVTRILITSKAKLNLTLKGSNVIDASSNSLPGIYVPNGAELVITGESTGSLNVTGASGFAGIGGMSMDIVGKISINGGTVNAIGGSGAAGIGSTSDGEATIININGGCVTAIGGNGAQAIGGANGVVSVIPSQGQKIIMKEASENDMVLGEYAVVTDITTDVSGMSSVYFETAEAGIGGTTGEVEWSLDSDGVFTVSGEGYMMDYVSEDEQPWKDYRDQIKTVVIGEGVTHVSYYGFYGCENLTSVTFENDRLYRIGEYSFYNCENLKTISIPEGTRVIGYNAFGCDEEGKGLDTAYIYARNAELSFYYDEGNDNTFPKHTLIYGYECSVTEVDYWCEKYGRTFVPLNGGCVVNIKAGEECSYDFENDYKVVDLWKASKAENGSKDSLMLDYTFTLDAEDVIRNHNYMVDSESEMLVKDGSNDGRIEVEIAFDLGEETVYKTTTYSFCPTDLDGAENADYNTWSTYAGDKPLFSMTSDGSIVNIALKGTLKDACEAYGVENPDYVAAHVRVTGITSYKKYQYGKYYTYDKNTQMEFHYMSLYDARGRDFWIDDIGPRPLDRAIYLTDNAPSADGYYEPVKREYIWEYDFTRICNDYDWENMETAPGDGGWDMDYFVEEYEGVLYGHARGIYNAGSDNSMKLADFINEENREFIESLVGENSWGIQIMANCTVILTYADGSTVELWEQAVREGTYIIAPCMHACSVCGLCMETEKMLPCNFNSNEWRSFYCECEESVPEVVETEIVEDVSVDMDNSMVYCEPTIVVEKIDLTTSLNTKYIKHITKGLVSDKAVMVFNVDLFDGDIPYQMNQWGNEEFLTVTIPVGSENAQKIKSGEILIYHISKNGKLDLVEIDFENGVDVENGTITFTSSIFSPFVLMEVSEETSVEAVYNEADDTCTAQITLTAETLRKEPVVYVAFYNNSGTFMGMKQKKVNVIADKYTVVVPDGIAECKVMLWESSLEPVCADGWCEVK